MTSKDAPSVTHTGPVSRHSFVTPARFTSVAATVFTMSMLMSGAATAQAVPGPGDIQRVPDRFEEPFEPLVRPEAPPLVAPTPGEEPADLEAVRFVLKGLVLEGNTVLPAGELEHLWEDKVETEISVLDLYRIANAVTAAYRDAGFILSQAIVPAQRIGENGIARIRIVEGFVGRVVVEGAGEDETSRIHNILRKIEASRPLNVRDLERYLLLVDDLSGVSVESVLRPALEELGAAELVVSVTRGNMVEGYAQIDNRGSRLLGAVQTELGASANNLFGLDGQAAIRVIASSPVSELRYGEARYLQPIGTEGVTVNFSFLRASTKPSGALRQLEIEGQSTEGRIEVVYPIIRSRLENLRLRAGVKVRDSETTAIGNTELADDDLRIISIGATYDWFDAWRGVNLISVDVSHGLDLFGASDRTDPNLSRAGGRADFTKLTGEVSRLQGLGSGFGLLATGAFQQTGEALLASEEFGAGGDRFGRGYDPSEITGDRGAAASLELRYTPELNLALLQQAQFYGFYDVAAVWQNDVPATDRLTLASAGIGVRLGFLDRAAGFIEVTQPLTHEIANRRDKDPRLLGGLTVRF